MAHLHGLLVPPRIVDGDFAGWLRDAMAARRLSARMVGMRTGINHSTVTRLLSGRREPSLATLLALLSLFGTEPLDDRAVRRPIVALERWVRDHRRS